MSVASAPRAAQNGGPLQLVVRAGFVARGLTYGMIGALALALALGAAGGQATNQQGALAVVAHAPLGGPAVTAIAVGLLAYALWKFWLTATGTGPEGGGGDGWFDRVQNFVGGVSYVGLFAISVSVLMGNDSGSSSAQQTRSNTAGVLGWTGGRELVFVAGLTLVVISVVQIVLALRKHFHEDNKTEQMDADGRRWFTVLGQVGLSARAVVFILVGWFFIRAAVDFDPGKAVSVDGALRHLADQAYGRVLLAGVAAGLIVFGVFSAAEARYRKL